MRAIYSHHIYVRGTRQVKQTTPSVKENFSSIQIDENSYTRLYNFIIDRINSWSDFLDYSIDVILLILKTKTGTSMHIIELIIAVNLLILAIINVMQYIKQQQEKKIPTSPMAYRRNSVKKISVSLLVRHDD